MRTYHPLLAEDVPASPPHPRGASYRVSIGLEYWEDGRPHRVEKVQMVYAGRVSGRRAPSYPADSPDHEHVSTALRRLRERAMREASSGLAENAGQPGLGDLIGSAKGIYGGSPREIEAYLKSLDEEWN